MNRFAKDMLMAKYGDGRGYSSNDSEHYSSNDGIIREPHYSLPDDRFEHLERQRIEDERRMRGYGDNRGMDYGDYRRSDYERRDYGDYRSDYMNEDYRRRDYGYNEADYNRSDYGETQYGKMSKRDIEKWKSSFKNADGTMGEHFKKEQIEQVTRKMGIDVHHLGGMEVFCLATNMMYADFCATAKKFGVNQLDFYTEMAKAFLLDKDFKGKPEEKIWLYYKCIAEQE